METSEASELPLLSLFSSLFSSFLVLIKGGFLVLNGSAGDEARELVEGLQTKKRIREPIGERISTPTSGKRISTPRPVVKELENHKRSLFTA